MANTRHGISQYSRLSHSGFRLPPTPKLGHNICTPYNQRNSSNWVIQLMKSIRLRNFESIYTLAAALTNLDNYRKNTHEKCPLRQVRTSQTWRVPILTAWSRFSLLSVEAGEAGLALGARQTVAAGRSARPDVALEARRPVQSRRSGDSGGAFRSLPNVNRTYDTRC